MIHINPADMGTLILLAMTACAVVSAGAFAISDICSRHQARNWKRTSEHWRKRAVEAEEAFAASEADVDFYRHQANSYRNRLFAAGKLTKPEASDHARAIGAVGIARQRAGKAAA